MNIFYKKLHPAAIEPRRSTPLSGGWDIFCTEIIHESTDFCICKTGLIMYPEDSNYRITLVPRSSLTKTHWLLQNSPGLGDPDYTGEYEFRFRALPTLVWKTSLSRSGYMLQYPEFPFKPGDRIGQMYLEEIIPIDFFEIDTLKTTTRGSGGFGSTGI